MAISTLPFGVVEDPRHDDRPGGDEEEVQDEVVDVEHAGCSPRSEPYGHDVPKGPDDSEDDASDQRTLTQRLQAGVVQNRASRALRPVALRG